MKVKVNGAFPGTRVDGFAGNLDACLYVYFFPLEPNDYAKTPLVDRHVPLFQLVYHGIILSNPFTGTLNYPVKAPNGSSGPSI